MKPVFKKRERRGSYNIVVDGEVVGYVMQYYVGRWGYADHRWQGEYRGILIYGHTRKEAVERGIARTERPERTEAEE
jgi:hypothetical protein